jgi:hypothetical protein
MKRQVGKSMDDREAVRIGDTRPDLPDLANTGRAGFTIKINKDK